jgi:hypothetical protein
MFLRIEEERIIDIVKMLKDIVIVLTISFDNIFVYKS